MFVMLPSRKRKFCPHCQENVSTSTFYEHRDRYFRNGKWLTPRKKHSESEYISFTRTNHGHGGSTNNYGADLYSDDDTEGKYFSIERFYPMLFVCGVKIFAKLKEKQGRVL